MHSSIKQKYIEIVWKTETERLRRIGILFKSNVYEQSYSLLQTTGRNTNKCESVHNKRQNIIIQTEVLTIQTHSM